MNHLKESAEEKMQLRGRGAFVWKEGVLKYGIRIGVISAVIRKLFLLFVKAPSEPWWESLVFFAIVALICGWSVGRSIWVEK
jgi:hypothetical protein